MARPSLVPINSGNQGWDGDMDDNFDVIGSNPLPIHEDAGITESTIAGLYPPAAYDRCVVWVNHTIYGYVLYYSDGTNWRPFDPQRRLSRTVTALETLTLSEQASLILASGTLPYTLTLEAASLFKGRSIAFKTLVTGTLTIAAAGGDTIDGASTKTITTQYDVLRLYCDGTSYYLV